MRIARLHTPAGPRHAVAVGDQWNIIVDPFAVNLDYTGESIPAADAVLLAAVAPHVVVGIGHNKPGHPLPMQAWHKSVHTVAGSGEDRKSVV